MECAWVWSEADMQWILVPSLTRSGSLRIYMLSLSLTYLNDPPRTIIIISPVHYVCHLCASRCSRHAPLPMELPDTKITSLCPCGSGGLPFLFCYCDYNGSIGSKGLVNWGAGPVGWFLHSRHFLFPYSLTLVHQLGLHADPWVLGQNLLACANSQTQGTPNLLSSQSPPGVWMLLLQIGYGLNCVYPKFKCWNPNP